MGGGGCGLESLGRRELAAERETLPGLEGGVHLPLTPGPRVGVEEAAAGRYFYWAERGEMPVEVMGVKGTSGLSGCREGKFIGKALVKFSS